MSIHVPSRPNSVMKTKPQFLIAITCLVTSIITSLAFPSFDPMSDASYTVGSTVAGKTDQGGDTWIAVAKNRGTNSTSANPATTYSTTDISTNDQVFVVIAYTFNGAATNDDIVKMWINPSSSTYGQPSEPATTIQAGTAAVCTAANQSG